MILISTEVLATIYFMTTPAKNIVCFSDLLHSSLKYFCL